MVVNGSISLSRPGQVLGNYIAMAKPGIVLGNLVTLAGGFFLAAKGVVHIPLLLGTMLGLVLVVASGCALNNVIDRDIDGVMQRTRNRPLVRGALSARSGLLYATLLGLAGFILLAIATNPLTTLIAAIGYVIYVAVYSLYMKRNSIYGTLVGSLSGAVPPVVGYCAVTGRFDLGTLLLFAIFSLWQIPHFYAIALFRLQDYQIAGIPVWPVARGVASTKRQMAYYITAFTSAAALLSLTGYVGHIFLAVSLVSGGVWLRLAWAGRTTQDDRLWAHKLFVYSIVVVMAISIAMSLDYVRS